MDLTEMFDHIQSYLLFPKYFLNEFAYIYLFSSELLKFLIAFASAALLESNVLHKKNLPTLYRLQHICK